jgi:hypothetical protein
VTLTRDPVSEHFDQAAAALLARAHARRGLWTQTTLANPSPRWEAWALAHGRRLLGPDDARSGTARTAWARSFIRSVYYVHKETRTGYSLQFRVGTVKIRRTATGLSIGRIIQVKLEGGGDAAWAAAERAPARRRFLDDGPAASYPEDRWWQA